MAAINSTLRALNRHARGERATERYIDPRTMGEVTVSLRDPVPPFAIPFLGAIDTTEESIASPGWRPIRLLEIETRTDTGKVVALCQCENTPFGGPGGTRGVILARLTDAGMWQIVTEAHDAAFDLLTADERTRIARAIVAARGDSAPDEKACDA